MTEVLLLPYTDSVARNFRYGRSMGFQKARNGKTERGRYVLGK